jgi:hypothetical protein
MNKALLASTRAAVLAFAVSALAACSTHGEVTSPNAPPSEQEDVDLGREAQTATDTAITVTRDNIGDAAMQPLEDLNLRRDEIPAVLREISHPYEPAGPFSCAEIAVAVQALSEALGPDIDVIAARRSMGERAGEAAGDAAVGTVRDTAGDLIPFRGIVRNLSGAKAHERRLARAENNGLIRRAYLKGLGQAQGCGAPAAPLPLPPPEVVPVEYRRGGLSR